MKIVIEYYYGGSEECCGSHEIVCMEYESCEALYCHLEEAIKNYLKLQEIYQDEWRKSDEKRKNITHRYNNVLKKYQNKIEKEEEFNQEWTEWLANRPTAPAHEIKINDIIFDLCVGMPEIKELNEWFNSKLQEN